MLDPAAGDGGDDGLTADVDGDLGHDRAELDVVTLPRSWFRVLSSIALAFSR